MPYFTLTGKETSLDDILAMMLSINPQFQEQLTPFLEGNTGKHNDYNFEKYGLAKVESQLKIIDKGDTQQEIIDEQIIPSEIQNLITNHRLELEKQVEELQSKKIQELSEHPLMHPRPPTLRDPPTPPEKIIHQPGFEQDHVWYPPETYSNPYYKEQMETYTLDKNKYDEVDVPKYNQELLNYPILLEQEKQIVMKRKEIVERYDHEIRPIKDKIDRLNDIYETLQPGSLTKYDWHFINITICDELDRSKTDRSDELNAIKGRITEICAKTPLSDVQRTEELIHFLQQVYIYANEKNSRMKENIANILNMLNSNMNFSLVPVKFSKSNLFDSGLSLFSRTFDGVKQGMQTKGIILESSPDQCLAKIQKIYGEEISHYKINMPSFVSINTQFTLEKTKKATPTLVSQ